MNWSEVTLRTAEEIISDFESRFLINPGRLNCKHEVIDLQEVPISIRWREEGRFASCIDLDDYITTLGGRMGVLPKLGIADFDPSDKMYGRLYRKIGVGIRAKKATSRIEDVNMSLLPEYLREVDYRMVVGSVQASMIRGLSYKALIEHYDLGEIGKYEQDYKICDEIEKILRAGYALCGMSDTTPDVTFYVYG